MVPKLSAFYFTNLLPELSAPRKDTTTGIRLATVPWFEPTKKATVTKSLQSPVPSTSSQSTRPQRKVTQSPKSPVPSTSSQSTSQPDPPVTAVNRNRTTTRQPRLKLVGRRINHKWEEADGTHKWYTASVIGVKSGKDGDRAAVYHVYYEEEDETYDIEGLVGDYDEGSLKFCDL